MPQTPPHYQHYNYAALSINPDFFREDFSVDSFLVTLTKDVIEPKQQQDARALSDEAAAKDTIERVLQLQKRFARAEDEIALLSHKVTAQLLDLQHGTSQDDQNYKAEVRTLEKLSERLKDGTRDIDSRVAHISQTATRIGDRLQTAEAVRLRCLEAQELICHLQTFSCHSAGSDFSKLPGIFTNDATLAEAAAVTRRLTHLATEVLAAKQRSKAITAESPGMATPGNTGGIGSVEHTLKVLEGYSSWLENRVVSRFDAAIVESNYPQQAQVVAIMTELDKEKSIAKRWVSSRPMFLAFAPEMLDDWLRRANREAAAAAASADEDDSGLTDPDDAVTRQGRVLARLYREMHASAKEEFAAAAQVFPKPAMVLEMFLSRLLEQNVQAVLERLLLPSSIGMATLAAIASQQQQQQQGPAAAAGQGTSLTGLNSASNTPGHSRTNSLRERATNLASSFSREAGATAAAAAAAVGTSAAASPGGGPGPTAAAAGGGGAAGGSAQGAATQQSAGLQRQQLRLLVEAYGKTQRLASNMEKSVRPIAQLDVVSMAEGLWPNFLGNYQEQELQWLAAACAEEVASHESPELDMDVCLQLMSWNKEAIQRALKLSAPNKAARNCRALFHHLLPGPTGGPAASPAAAGQAGAGGSAGGAQAGGVPAPHPVAHPGCLLEQLARHILGGVEYSLELCTASSGLGLGGSRFKLGFGTVTRANSNQMAADFVNERIRKALAAAHVSSSVMTALQVYFSGVVAPAVTSSVAELSLASSALLSLIRAVEDSITVVLRKCLDAFMAELERVLSSEQRRSDFMPRDDTLSFDRPTSACLLGTALLSALGGAAKDTLDGNNLRAFLAEVARRCYQLLLTHMTRFSYSPTGALKWKKDVSEYAEVLAGYGVPAADEDMAYLQQLLNVLVVAPDSLLGLVNSSLRMAHRDALRYISLREDFKVARVDGKPLLVLFSGEGLESHLGR